MIGRRLERTGAWTLGTIALLFFLAGSVEGTSARELSIRYPAEFCCPPGLDFRILPRKRITFIGQNELDDAVSKHFLVSRRVGSDARDDGNAMGVLSLRLTSFVLSTPRSSGGFTHSGTYRATLELSADFAPPPGGARERWTVKISAEREFPPGLKSWRTDRATRVTRTAFRDAAAAVIQRLTRAPFGTRSNP